MAFVQVLDRIADVAQIVRGAPNATLIGAYVRAARRFCTETRWLRQTVTGESEAGTRLYDLGSDPYLEILGLRAMSAQGPRDSKPRALVVSDTTTWNPGRQPAAPIAYAYVPEGQFALDPIPDDVYSLTCTVIVKPKEGATQLPDGLLVKWDQVLQAGALEYLLALPGMPWTDGPRSMLEGRRFAAGINNARADEQREFNAGPGFIKRRRFVLGTQR